jgi:hypothetical protein
MPIRRELRDLYSAHWRELSRRVRFERARGMCQGCGRPHGATVRCLPDGRWYDPVRNTWQDRRGRPARRPDLEQMLRLRTTRVVLAAAHLDHDPANNGLRNLGSICQRCHLTHDRPHHLTQRRITYLLRRALGDLFFRAVRIFARRFGLIVAKHAQAGKMLRGSETRGYGQEPSTSPRSWERAAIAVLLEPSPKQEAHSIDGVLLTPLTEATAREWLEDYGRSDLAGSLFKNGRIFIIRIEIDIRLLHRIDAAAEAAGMMEQA